MNYVRKKQNKKKYIVVFQDEDNTVLKTTFVSAGGTAQPPDIPAKKGETEHYETVFARWDTDYSRVENNLVVKAVYEEVPKKYLVMYFHENDRLLGMESVPYGSPAKAEIYPEKKEDEEYEYIFERWSRPLDCIKGDTNVRAVFQKKRKVFRVRFFHEDGSLLKEEQVAYGKRAETPDEPKKERDAVYHYLFQGWSQPTIRVTENMDIYAVFSAIYNEYTIAFYDGEKTIAKINGHYGDPVDFPAVSKKGYDLFWSKTPEKVEESCEIHVRWIFSNPVGKEVRSGSGIYRIVNPSIKNGTVVLTKYVDTKSVRITLPDRVKLGDYYYTVEGIGSQALVECTNMEKLCLPDSVLYVEESGLAGCRRMKSLQCGKSLRSFAEKAFIGDVRLKEIYLPGIQFTRCHKNAFGSQVPHFRLYVSPENRRRVERAMETVNSRDKIKIIDSAL